MSLEGRQMRRTESLLVRPWLIVLIVATLVALPVIVLGETSASDSRDRLRAAELESLAKTADRAAASLTESLDSVTRQVSAGSATPISGKATSLLLAIERNDPAELNSFASYLLGLLTPQVLRIIVLDNTGRVLALEPLSDRVKLGADLSDREVFARVSKTEPTYKSGMYTTDTSCECAVTITTVIGVSSFVADSQGARAGVVLAEVDVHLLGRALTAARGATDDIYVIDSDGRFVMRASQAFTPDPAVGQDLRGSPAAIAALSGASKAEAEDPLDGGARLIGIAPVSTLGWRVLAMRSPNAIQSQLDGPLLQGRAARLVLAAVLLLGSALFARTAGRVIRQRRQLNQSLVVNAQLLSDLRATSKELESANRHKSEFLANMSHELRTPLNAIIGFADVLGERMFGDLNERQADYLQDIRSSGKHLLALINDILDLSKVEAGRMELTLAEFSLEDALSNGMTMIRERATLHRIALELQIDGVEVITADERKVNQIVFNLLSNAVKFTPDGGTITVTAGREDGQAHVSVRDTGVGIAVEDRERVFEEFRQARGGSAAAVEGTGLGLSLTKALVELHHGRIWLESELGRGSTFNFTLPLRQNPTAVP
jgi:signal transduction histidine kinase